MRRVFKEERLLSELASPRARSTIHATVKANLGTFGPLMTHLNSLGTGLDTFIN